MSRTNIDLPDELVAEVMRRFHLDTKKSAVELALQRLVEQSEQSKIIDEVFGIGWDVELTDLRPEFKPHD